MTGQPFRSLTFAFHPTSRGFGWVAFESPLSVFDHGLVTARGERKNAQCVERVAKLFERLRPEFLVIEAFGTESAQRSKRIRELCLDVVSLAAEQGLELAVYTRSDVQATFATVGARTRDEIAEAAVRHLPALAVRFPGKRKDGDSEDKRLSIFSAAALVLTHYHHGSLSVFEAVKRTA